MKPRTFVLILAGLALIAGIVVMSLPVSIGPDVDTSISCGNAWSPRTGFGDQFAGCKSAVATNRWLGIGLMVGGGIGLAGAALVNNNARTRTRDPEPQADQ